MSLTLLFMLASLLFIRSGFVAIVVLMVGCLVTLMNLHSFFSTSFCLFLQSHFMGNLMVFLAIFLALCVMVAHPEGNYKFQASVVSLTIILMCAFSVKNLLVFYLMFELSLLPTLYLILAWGYQPERLQAGLYMMIYTVGASLPLLLFILYLYSISSTLDLYLLEMNQWQVSGYMFIIVILAFLAKMPCYTLHLWLPKAHVEAPLAGSMLLAGILLKLGSYGLYIFTKILAYPIYSSSIMALVSLMLWGGVLSSIQCLMQSDIKAYVAYSSITHMSLVSVALLMNYSWGLFSATLTMLAHGFTSSAMFLLAFMTYKVANSRSLLFMGGYLQIYPHLSLLWFVFCCINMAAPPSLNFVGEICFLGCVMNLGWVMTSVSLSIMFLSVLYNMVLYMRINHGMPAPFVASFSPSFGVPQYLSLFLHFSVLFMIFKLTYFIS